MVKWQDLVQGLIDRVDTALSDDDKNPQIDEEVLLKRAVEKAKSELLAARSFFDSVSDPDMIDHAIYKIQAAEKKYAYLLKFARERGYRQSLNETLQNSLIGEEVD